MGTDKHAYKAANLFATAIFVFAWQIQGLAGQGKINMNQSIIIIKIS